MGCSVSGAGTAGHAAGEAVQHTSDVQTDDTLPAFESQLASTLYL